MVFKQYITQKAASIIKALVELTSVVALFYSSKHRMTLGDLNSQDLSLLKVGALLIKWKLLSINLNV